MGTTVKLDAADGHRLDAYRADPRGKAKAGLVVCQEIFGVNSHMRKVCDEFAADGYAAVAPALFDRVERGVEIGYAEADIARGRDVRAQCDIGKVLLDIAAAAALVRPLGQLGIVGYCWGGRLVWLSACRLEFDAAVVYYGGSIAETKDEKARCPVMMHFGETDASIPMADVEAIRKAQPRAVYHLYPAGHGFNCDQRGSYHAESAKSARLRTLAFLARHLKAA